MRLFVGLGNPGRAHAGQRHNVGFMALDRIAERHGFAPWRAKFQGDVAEGRIGDVKVMALKPMTYMNLSGQAVGEAARWLKLTPRMISVFHDELDLAPGKLRVKAGGGHAGHNGLRSIEGHLGPDTRRVRIGIGHPGDKTRVSGWVLSDFAAADAAWLGPLLDAIAEAAPLLAADQPEQFQTRVALLTQPPKPERPAPAEAATAPTPGPTPSPATPASPEPEGPFAALKRLGRPD